MSAKAKTKKQSCYQRHGKRPYDYSPEYKEWRRCMARGDNRGAIEATRVHRKRFGP